MSLEAQIDRTNLPQHIAIIMDGNGRWAKEQGMSRVLGHKNGVGSVREVAEAAAELGIQHITLYAFSTENWARPKHEVNALMELLVETIKSEMSTLKKNKIQLNAIGNLSELPESCQINLKEAIEETSNHDHMTLTLALSYSARWELENAMQTIAHKIERKEISANQVNEELISKHLNTANMPDPELLIRTSGEKRISNFLLWQIAYSELYFTDTLWPDFKKDDLFQAIIDYQKRERRFGKTSEQVNQL
ncbi:MAG: isoprenyl transferase [Saprospiraceae bacterium]|nr:isoprenyl transferase [Saprospiraceae bacterium]